jgi:hypothetical protein
VINNTNEIYSDISNSGLSSIFQTGSFSTVMVDEILQYSDNYDNYQINLQTNQILNLSYQILDFENPQSLINNAAMRISGEIESNSAGELRISNSNEAFAAYGTDLSLYNIIKEDNCYNRQTDFNSVGDNVGIFVCTLSLQSSTDITLKLNKFSAISSVNNFLIDLDINHICIK